MRNAVLILGALILFVCNVSAQEKTVVIPKAEEGADIDGILNEEVWRLAARFTLDYETYPGENLPAKVKTEVYVFYNDQNLFIAFKAFDPRPEEIRANYWQRDRISGDDDVWFELDTFNDGMNAFAFQSNPLGIQGDYICINGEHDSSWDAIWDVEARITDFGFVVEFKIPFDTISFQSSESEQTWGLELGRSYPREVTYEFRPFTKDRDMECYVCQFDKIRGFKAVKPGKNIELTPTLSAIQSHQYNPPLDDFVKTSDELEAGFNAKWGITNNVTAAMTVNPDFSQVEADALQLDINTPFALSYDEKRPFFLEGMNYFDSRLDVLYTRSIRDPEWGLKLFGKEGGYGFGLLMVEDSVTNLLFSGSQRSSTGRLNRNNTTTVARVSKDIHENSTISALVTNREADDYYNRVYGFDTSYQLSPSDRIWIQALGSSTRYPDEIAVAYKQPVGEFTSSALDIYYVHSAENFSLVAHYANFGEDFRADAGFIPQVGYRKAAVATNNTWYPEKSWFNRVMVETVFRDYSDADGHMLSQQASASFIVTGEFQSSMRLQGQAGRKAYLGNEYKDSWIRFIGGCRPADAIKLYLHAQLGEAIDYVNQRPGDRIFIDSSITFQPDVRLNFDFAHTFERMDVGGNHLYTANIASLTTIFHFDSRTLLRLIAQYTDYQYSPENYLVSVDSEYQKLSTQLLISYKVNPRTLVFVGYSDNYLGDSLIEFRKDDYTYFAKISYAFKL